MAGEVKRKYGKTQTDFSKRITKCVNSIIPILPQRYNKEDLLTLFQTYYPYEWHQIQDMFTYYRKLDDFLELHGKKRRYNFPQSKAYFYSHPKVRIIIKYNFIKQRAEKYSEEERNNCENELKAKRQKSINKWNNKIENINKLKIHLEPDFLDAYIALYKHTKDIEERIEILREIQKYDCEKSIDFLYCVNDGSGNNQLRQEAFKLLQNSGHFVILRKNFKGKHKDFTLHFLIIKNGLLENYYKN